MNGRITKVVFDSDFINYKPTSTDHWFYCCPQIKSIVGLQYLNTEQVTDMSYMFYNCYALEELDLSNFNTANVTSMFRMFYYCSALTSLDVSGFNVAEVTVMTGMFGSCSNLTTIYCNDDWNSNTLDNSSNMFQGCTKLKGAVAFDANKVDVTMANPTTGYFTKDDSGISQVEVSGEATIEEIYTINSVRHSKLQQGLNIVRMSDGTIRKIIRK